jgi:ADP-dependent NAD(P)H-hydrate dehydratase / NAD(P)H-hydrate epimerase
MIKILNTERIRELDKHTLQQEGIPSIDLMERACRAFMVWFTERFNALHKVGVVCGPGNNGGDGLGIARMLKEWGYPVKVWIVKGGGTESADLKVNLQRVHDAKIPCFEISTEADQNLFHDRDVIIDALFGSGLSRPLEGIYAQAIRCINKTPAKRVSVDVPSGLLADAHSEGDAIVEAHYTITFQLPKLSFFLPQYFRYVGDWHVVDIGLSKQFIKSASASAFVISRKGAQRLLRPRSKFDHKGTFGHALLVSGSLGKIGASIMSGSATLRAGVGLLTLHIPKCGYVIAQTALPEAMVLLDKEDEFISSVGDTSSFTTIGIGPGLGQHPATVKTLKQLLEGFTKPVVIDADALNILAANRELLHLIPPGSILTPHPKEFERLSGSWKNDFDRLDKQRDLARLLKSVVLVKGAYTTIASPDGELFFNMTGNPGMATGGTGDVLTGILTGLVAQKYPPLEAAILGTYLHGLAGDLGALEKGPESLVATDIPIFLPHAFRQLRH